MGLSYPRVVYFVALCVFIVLSVRPSPRLEGWLDWAFVPTRVLGEVASPFGWLSSRRVHAAERTLLELQPLEYETSLGLHADEKAYALPADRALRRGRRFVHAEVLARPEGNLDRLIVRLEGARTEGIEPQMPVVLGDTYVGRVACVQPSQGTASVDLVTGSDFFVGASVDFAGETEPVRLVVGGLSSSEANGAGYALAQHNPSRSDDLFGEVRVDESNNLRERFHREARGFVLGDLARLPGRDDHYEILPRIDYLHGLFQVVIVCPQETERPEGVAQADVFRDGKWLQVRSLGVPEPAPWREAIKLRAGTREGVYPGAAIVCAAHLIGRVQHAGYLTSDVSLLGDPGFPVLVQARVEQDPQPRVLGRLVSLGRAPGGRVRFHWAPIEPLPIGPGPEGGAPLPAQLFTGSGELGVPRGLAIGHTELPRGPGPHVLVVDPLADTRRLRRLWARRSEALPEDCP